MLCLKLGIYDAIDERQSAFQEAATNRQDKSEALPIILLLYDGGLSAHIPP
jgi:hypothetical protein